MSDLAEWLLACLNEDRNVGLRSWASECIYLVEVDSAHGPGWMEASCNYCDDWRTSGLESVCEEYGYEHAMTHPPQARYTGSGGWTVIDAEAKRRIIELHRADVDVCVPANPDDDAAFYAPWCPTLQALALPYADHPDYDESWRP